MSAVIACSSIFSQSHHCAFKHSRRVALANLCSFVAGIRPLAAIRAPTGDGSQNLASLVVKNK
jgi:hypothetical protein